MLKKIFSAKKSISSLALMLVVMAFAAVPAFAANPDLDTVTTALTDGAGDMKTNAMTVITVCIAIFIVIFGIGWLMSIFKKKMSKAA